MSEHNEKIDQVLSNDELKKSDTIAAVTQRAYEDLYAAKHAGKNRVFAEDQVD